MSKVVVADSSCLIALSKIGKLNILHILFGEITIPQAVYDEVIIKGEGYPYAINAAECLWMKTQQVENQLAVQTLRTMLGRGESETIILATQIDADYLILDDKKARIHAQALSLPVIGTVAVVQKAVEKNIISDFPSILKELATAGFRYKIKEI
jgi:uncharacterized protein